MGAASHVFNSRWELDHDRRDQAKTIRFNLHFLNRHILGEHIAICICFFGICNLIGSPISKLLKPFWTSWNIFLDFHVRNACWSANHYWGSYASICTQWIRWIMHLNWRFAVDSESRNEKPNNQQPLSNDKLEWRYRWLGFLSFTILFLSVSVVCLGGPSGCGFIFWPAVFGLFYSIRRIRQLSGGKSMWWPRIIESTVRFGSDFRNRLQGFG